MKSRAWTPEAASRKHSRSTAAMCPPSARVQPQAIDGKLGDTEVDAPSEAQAAPQAGALKVAVLDDYQDIAADYADWSVVPGGVSVHSFTEHIADRDALVAALEPFDVVVAMRERTRLGADVLDRLPRLRLLVTTGPFNAVIDFDAAPASGRDLLRDGRHHHPHQRAHLGADHRAAAPHPGGAPAGPRGRMAAHRRQRPRRQAAGRDRPRQPRQARRPRRRGVPDGRRRLEPEPHRRARRRGRRAPRRQGRAVLHLRRRDRSTWCCRTPRAAWSERRSWR